MSEVTRGLLEMPTEMAASDSLTAMQVIDALKAENARLLKDITDHNDDCLQICEWKADRGDCNAYRRRGRSCPDCPRHNRIAIPVADALLSTGGEG